jgi:hypothetical protein
MCLNPNPEVKPRQGRWEYLGVSILLHLHVTDLAIALPDIGIIITIINARSLDVSSDYIGYHGYPKKWRRISAKG